MAVEKRRSNGWQAFGSYTLSRASGLQVSSGATAAARRSARSPARRTSRSGRIRTASPTRAAGCRTIARTCCGSWAALTCRGRDRGRRQRPALQRQAVGGDARRSRCRRAASASCSSRAARAGCRRRRCVDLRVSRTDLIRRLDAHRAARGRPQRAQRHGGRGPGDGQLLCSPNFGQPNVFIDPRRAMLGVRLNLGR